LLALTAVNEAKRIVEEGKEKEECVVFCTWESSSEELSGLFLTNKHFSITDIARGNLAMDVVEKQAMRLVRLPIFILGKGVGRVAGSGIRMTPEIVYSAIESLAQDFSGIRPRLLLFDYIQIVPVKHHSERVAAVSEAAVRIKELSLTVGAPAFVGIQAARAVDNLVVKLPRKQDCQHSSAIEQVFDCLWGIWRPILTEEKGGAIELEDGTQLPVIPELAIARKLKERHNIGRATAALWFEPQYLHLAELELKNLNGPPRDAGHWADKYD